MAIVNTNKTVPTLTERFNTLGIQSTEESRHCFRRHAPVSIQGIVFLSGSQEERVAAVRLNAGWGSTGTYTDEMEGELVGAGSSAHRRTWDDD